MQFIFLDITYLEMNFLIHYLLVASFDLILKDCGNHVENHSHSDEYSKKFQFPIVLTQLLIHIAGALDALIIGG